MAEERLTPEQFVLRALETLGDPKRSKGIHSVYSGFNQAFREYFPDLNPVEATTQLAQAGKIEVRPVRGGVMLYKPGEAPSQGRGSDALRKMGLGDGD
jgi:hypothetical protein